VLEATTTREVVNGFVVVVDTDAMPNGTYGNAVARFQSVNHGELPGSTAPGGQKQTT
jgi:hypothetical protein